MVEAEKGEGFVTIPLLEDYCERAYRIYEQVNAMESGQFGHASIANNGNKYHKNLSNALMPVRNSIKNDIIIKREAVFLPLQSFHVGFPGKHLESSG